MKKSLLILFFFSFISAFAQLDREHWFAPMFDGQSNVASSQFLHLSTNDATPFTVEVYNNNIVIATTTISKGNPQIIPISRNFIITRSVSDLLTVGTMGLYVKAEKPCFANLRFQVTNHAEIITSKGTAGIGTKFYTVVAPNLPLSGNLGFGASILATEDNTIVTVNNFKKGLYFTNESSPITEMTFTLNKGQSYIIDGRSTTEGNKDGFIGATVTADKPISLSNGNFNGQYATANEVSGSDILMDQSVPVDKLGNEFVVVKGYGRIGTGMEGAIVVASEKNTAVYVNDSTTPIIVLQNEGDYYQINDSNYINRGNNHYNLHIKSDKNIYVYQLLAGVEGGGAPLATGGMNYIPPLNCYLPHKIDEISNINKISDGFENYTTKLNIITEKGATITVNGSVPNSLYGPFDISNNAARQQWVTYSIPNVSGNITIESNSAVTAGIASGSNAVGYGGYFAGFSSIPIIQKVEGDCLPNVKLAVIEGFKSYRWLIKVGNTYVDAPGKNDVFYYVPTQAGVYAVQVQQGTCTQVQTPDYKFYNCTTFTNTNYETCSEVEITPKFSLSSQTVRPETIKIDVQPTKGTVRIENGKLYYKANPNIAGIDTFKYSFCGNGTIPDCETAQATITIKQVVKTDVILKECTSTDTATFNLDLAPVTEEVSINKTFYQTLNGAENQIVAEKILNFKNFTTSDRFVFVRLQNTFGCTAIAKIELKLNKNLEVYPERYTVKHCDENIDGVVDGIYKVNVNTISPFVVDNLADQTIKYYDSQSKAIAGANNNILDNYSFSTNTILWIRAEPVNGCPAVVKSINLLKGDSLPISNTVNATVCDTDLDGAQKIKLKDYTSLFTNNSSATVFYYGNLTDAQNNTNTINTEEITVQNSATYYFRFKADQFCDAIGILSVTVKIPKKSELAAEIGICPDATTTLDAGSGFSSYLWSTGATSQSVEVPAGEYWVQLQADGCSYKQFVKVFAVPLPEITAVEIVEGTVTIKVTGGNAPYLYSLDGYKYQTSNVFTNIKSGDYTAYVISKDQCKPVTANFNIVRILNVITPNGDGKNDILDYSSLMTKKDPFLEIYDRYGAKVFSGSTANSFKWDGTVSGNKIFTANYYYIVQWQEPNTTLVTQYKGWVLVKNRN